MTHIRAIAVPVDGAIYTVMVSGAPSDLVPVSELSNDVFNTVTADPPKSFLGRFLDRLFADDSNPHASSPAYRAGRIIRFAAPAIALLVVAIVLIARKKARPSPYGYEGFQGPAPYQGDYYHYDPRHGPYGPPGGAP
jgi:hypothetical protein